MRERETSRERRAAGRVESRGRRLRAEIRGMRAFVRFCTPALSRHRAADHERLVERARFHLREARALTIATRAGEVRAYVLEPEGPARANVLLAHGWTGEAAFMSAFADYLRRRGFRSVLLDLPAHGASPGRRTSLIACAQAVGEVARALGPMRFALGHSIGALAVVAAGEGHRPLASAYPFEAFVLVAMPDRFAGVTGRFGRELGLGPAAQRAFERRLERLAHRGIDTFTGERLLAATGRPALLIHARDDDEVAFADAAAIAGGVPGAELAAFDGLGHRAILYAPPAIRKAGEFLMRQAG